METGRALAKIEVEYVSRRPEYTVAPFTSVIRTLTNPVYAAAPTRIEYTTGAVGAPLRTIVRLDASNMPV